jgi:hypothetical protein
MMMDGHALDSAARERVEHPQDAAGLLLKRLRERSGIDARDRDERADAVDDQSDQGEPDALLKVRRLRERREVDVGGELFCG